MNTIILINGLKRSGKDYTAELMQEYADINKESFAYYIKKIIATTFGITLDELDTFKNNTDEFGIEIKVYPNNQPEGVISYINFREILQRFGTEAMKSVFGDNIWAQITIKEALKNKNTVIPDFRFITEYNEAIKSGANVVTIKIINNDLENNDLHASETELEDKNFKFDYYLDNTGQPDLTEDVKDILSDIGILK